MYLPITNSYNENERSDNLCRFGILRLKVKIKRNLHRQTVRSTERQTYKYTYIQTYTNQTYRQTVQKCGKAGRQMCRQTNVQTYIPTAHTYRRQDKQKVHNISFGNLQDNTRNNKKFCMQTYRKLCEINHFSYKNFDFLEISKSPLS